jgi:hypothetical protein
MQFNDHCGDSQRGSSVFDSARDRLQSESIGARQGDGSQSKWILIRRRARGAKEHGFRPDDWLANRHSAIPLVKVGPVGLEPTTYGLKVRSSAN